VPTIHTDRLTLRAHRLDDFEPLAVMRTEPDFYRYLGGEPISHEDSWRRMMATVGHWVLHSYGFWLVEEAASGEVVGEVGFSDFRRDMQPSLQGTVEAGWALAPRFHGQGYGGEAMSAALQWAVTALPGFAITCIISPDNVASLALASRLGFTERCRTTYKDEPVLLMDWLPPVAD
jgi:RimJ/RimL family protein N-acetyltransferase